MNKHMITILSLSFLSLLALATGCAKREMIKADEPMPSSTAPKDPVSGGKSQSTEGGIAEEEVKQAPVMEEPAAAGANTFREETGLEAVYFDFDSYVLSPEARDILSRNSRRLKEKPSTKVLIEGHTDERGSDAYNIALGERRAQSALQYLLTMGIAAERLSVISYGEEKPAEAGHEEHAWSKNRRAKFVITGR